MRCILKVILCFQILLAFFFCNNPKEKTCAEEVLVSWLDSAADKAAFSRNAFGFDSSMGTRALYQFDTIVSLRLGDGWGDFVYYANIYVEHGQPKSCLYQYVDESWDWLKWNDSLVETDHGFRPGYVRIKKMDIQSDEWNNIFSLLDSYDYWCTHREANECSMIIDGESWTLAVKTGDKRHHVHWTECYYSSLDTGCINKCREMEHVAMKLFYLAGVSKNRYACIAREESVGRDSAKFEVFAPAIFPDHQVYYRGRPAANGKLVVSKQHKDWYNYLEIEEYYLDDTIRYKPSQMIWLDQ